MVSLEKSSSNSTWVKSEDGVSVVEKNSVRVFSERKPMEGIHEVEKNKIIPIDKILCIIEIFPKSTKRFGKRR